jgi:hypothetical protein
VVEAKRRRYRRRDNAHESAFLELIIRDVLLDQHTPDLWRRVAASFTPRRKAPDDWEALVYHNLIGRRR